MLIAVPTKTSPISATTPPRMRATVEVAAKPNSSAAGTQTAATQTRFGADPRSRAPATAPRTLPA